MTRCRLPWRTTGSSGEIWTRPTSSTSCYDDDTASGEHYVAVFGASRVGKSALVRSVCQSGRLRGTFDQIAWFTVRYPFNRNEFTTTVERQLGLSPDGHPTAVDGLQQISKLMNKRRTTADDGPLRRAGGGGKQGRRNHNLLVVDDVSSKDELDRIKLALHAAQLGVSRVIVITREPTVAQLFHKEDKYEILPLKPRDALHLFNKKLENVPSALLQHFTLCSSFFLF